MVYALVCSEYLAIIIRKYIKACRTELIAWTTTLLSRNVPDSKVHGANMRPIWGRQDPGGPHVGPMNFAIWGSSVSATHLKVYGCLIFKWVAMSWLEVRSWG